MWAWLEKIFRPKRRRSRRKGASKPARSPGASWTPPPEDPIETELEELCPEDIVPSAPSRFSEHKATINALVSVFETGSPRPDYGSVVVLDDGAGITYGKHQSTDRSDSLDAIVQRYIELEGTYAAELAEYLDALDADATALEDPDHLPDWVHELVGLLSESASDPKMRQAQDEVFDSHYWKPALQTADNLDLVLPLSMLVIYDSTIHGGLDKVRPRFPELPPSAGGDEHAWVVAYLKARKEWLSDIGIGWTDYRIDAMLKLCAEGNWHLETPIQIDKPRATIG